MIIQYHEHLKNLKWERVCVRCFLSISTPTLPTTLKTNGSSLENWWLVKTIVNFPSKNLGPFEKGTFVNCSGPLFVFFQPTCATTSTEKLDHFHIEVSSYTMISISLMLQLGCFFHVKVCVYLGKTHIKQKTLQAFEWRIFLGNWRNCQMLIVIVMLPSTVIGNVDSFETFQVFLAVFAKTKLNHIMVMSQMMTWHMFIS